MGSYVVALGADSLARLGGLGAAAQREVAARPTE